MIRLIAIDIDGTLLDSSSRLTDEVKQAVKKASSEGVKIVLSSGRPFKGLKWLLKELDLIKKDEYTISMNGTQVVSNFDEKRIYKKYINVKDAKEVSRVAYLRGSSFFFFSGEENITCEKFDEYVNIESTLNKMNPVVLSYSNLDDNDEVCKMTFTSSKEILDSLQDEVVNKYKGRFTCVRSHKNFIELFNPESSKGEALKFLCSYLNIPLAETMAIGDNDNDFALLSEAHYKIVMANSCSESLRSISTEIAPSNDENGVAFIIDKYLKEN